MIGKHMAKIQFRNNDTSGNGQITIDGAIPMWTDPTVACEGKTKVMEHILLLYICE